MERVPLAAVAPLPAAPKLSVRAVSMSFGRRCVLSDVSFDVAAGQLVCILGPSGCGKTTLLSILGGFVRPSSGAVLVDGEPVRGPHPLRICVFQEGGVFPWLTVADNVGFGLRQQRSAERDRLVAHYVALVGLDGFAGAYPHELSGGMKQRVEVARALAAQPDLLLLDEPFGALDSITRLVMRRELLRIQKAESKTIVFVTHDIDEALQLADHVIVLATRPATIQRDFAVAVPHPRDPGAPALGALRGAIFAELGFAYR